MERNHPEEQLTLEKEGMEVFKATKSHFALRFLRFARDNLKFAQKFEPNLRSVERCFYKTWENATVR